MFMEIDEGFLEHPKTLQLCATMGNPLAFGYLLHFWRWACRSCKDGDLSGLSEYVIEEAAKYHQHDGKLFKAMAAKLGGKPGFIDVDDSGAPVRIHNWEKRTGGAIARMDAKVKANKDRREAARLKHECSTDSGTMPESKPPQSVHDAGQSRQDKTSQDKSSQGDPPARDPGTTDTDAGVLTERWYGVFKAEWLKSKGRQYGQGNADVKAKVRLTELLSGLAEEDRQADWASRGRFLSEFLSKADQSTTSAGWSFAFFVSDFNGLRVPPEKRPQSGNGNGRPQPQANWGKPVTMADVEAARKRQANG